jgi:hypothetical protein
MMNSHYNQTKDGVDTTDRMVRNCSTKRGARRWRLSFCNSRPSITSLNNRCHSIITGASTNHMWWINNVFLDNDSMMVVVDGWGDGSFECLGLCHLFLHGSADTTDPVVKTINSSHLGFWFNPIHIHTIYNQKLIHYMVESLKGTGCKCFLFNRLCKLVNVNLGFLIRSGNFGCSTHSLVFTSCLARGRHGTADRRV